MSNKQEEPKKKSTLLIMLNWILFSLCIGVSINNLRQEDYLATLLFFLLGVSYLFDFIWSKTGKIYYKKLSGITCLIGLGLFAVQYLLNK